jgi:magnesium-transporting ATPase (P-type)
MRQASTRNRYVDRLIPNPRSLLFAVALAVGLDILCSDKTGTLTEGRMQVSSITDASGKGAPESVIEVCSAVVEPQGQRLSMTPRGPRSTRK